MTVSNNVKNAAYNKVFSVLIWFRHTEPISLCVDSFMFIFVYFVFICFRLRIYHIIVMW